MDRRSILKSAAALAPGDRVSGLTTKAFLKRYARRYLPPSLIAAMGSPAMYAASPRRLRPPPRTDIHAIILRSAHASKTKRVPVYPRKSFVGTAARAIS
jgi:hypothetical protein